MFFAYLEYWLGGSTVWAGGTSPRLWCSASVTVTRLREDRLTDQDAAAVPGAGIPRSADEARDMRVAFLAADLVVFGRAPATAGSPGGSRRPLLPMPCVPPDARCA